LDIADCYELLSGPMREALKDPASASQVYRGDLSHFICKDGELAAVLLVREISPARMFVQMRAVSRQFQSFSRQLNAELLARVLSKCKSRKVEAYEFSARRNVEAETVAMARRSGGLRLSIRQVFEWPVSKYRRD